MHRDTRQHLTRARNAVDAALGDSGEPQALAFARVAAAELEMARKNLAAVVDGDRGGFDEFINHDGNGYRVVRFDPQIDTRRNEQGYIGALVLESRGAMFVASVRNGNRIENVRKMG